MEGVGRGGKWGIRDKEKGEEKEKKGEWDRRNGKGQAGGGQFFAQIVVPRKNWV